MSLVSRRVFSSWLAAGAGLLARPRALWGRLVPSEAQPNPILDTTSLRALAAAVLPSELGNGGIEVAADAFGRWIAGYRDNATALLPYGSADISTIPPLPRATWKAQLAALDTEATRQHNLPFARCTVAQRRGLIEAALSAVPNARLGEPARAPHIGLALLSFWVGTPEATDLAYRARITPKTCRPLVHNSRNPLPLAGGPA